jgi:hypothetical protein
VAGLDMMLELDVSRTIAIQPVASCWAIQTNKCTHFIVRCGGVMQIVVSRMYCCSVMFCIEVCK